MVAKKEGSQSIELRIKGKSYRFTTRQLKSWKAAEADGVKLEDWIKAWKKELLDGR
jgi:hypothetical protein